MLQLLNLMETSIDNINKGVWLGSNKTLFTKKKKNEQLDLAHKSQFADL